DSLVDVVQAWLGVARDQQLVRWAEVEEVATHEAPGQSIAAGQGLNLRLVPRPSLCGFVGNDEACALKSRDLGWMAVVFGGEKHLHRRGDGVVVEDAFHSIRECGLAVRASAKQKHEHVLVYESG